MELRNRWILLIGLGVVFILAIFRISGKNSFHGGKKIATFEWIANDPYYKKQLRIYKIGAVAIKTVCLLCIFSCFAMLCRPALVEKVDMTDQKRDIFLCMDISTSVDALNEELVENLKEVANHLQGDRFGIAIFNTSSVVLVPLTDDYDYVIECLDMIHEALRNRAGDGNKDYRDSWFVDQYISSGTLMGNEVRGSSLIGDGLASCVYYFDKEEEDRTRIIIFSSDNDLQGEPTVTTKEAGEICKDHNILVYGIGTLSMNYSDDVEMREAVETTGGIYYRQQEDFSVSQIVGEIEKQQKSETKGIYEIVKTDQPMIPFLMILISFSVLTILNRIMKVEES